MIPGPSPVGPKTGRPRFDPRRLLDFEDPAARLAALAIVLTAALLSPDLALPGGLPAVRLDQIVLLLYLPSLGRHLLRHPEAGRVGPVDAVFGLLVVAIGASIVLAPILVPQVGRTYHDLFDVARPVEYWFLYRLGRLSPADGPAARWIVVLAAAAAVVEGLFAVAQRFGPSVVNEALTVLWTGAGHNLAVVVRGGRAVGTVGQANDFGLLCALVVALLLITLMLHATDGRARRGLLLALGLATVGLVLSQSRSATFGLAGALVLGLVALALLRVRLDPRPLVVVAVAGLLAAGAVVAVPAANGSSILERFDVGTLGSDTSVVVRVARLRSALARPDEDLEERILCDGTPSGTIQPGHEPQPFLPAPEAFQPSPTTSPSATSGASPRSSATATPSPSPTPAPDLATAAGRDQQRKADVAAIADAIRDRFCATATWPTDLATVWPEGDDPPLDPGTGEPYEVVLDGHGFTVGAQLEADGDLDGRTYTLTSSPDLIEGPSFEAGGSAWQVGPGTDLTIVPGGRFGELAGQVTDGPQAQIHQYVLYAFDPSRPYAAQAWARADGGRSSAATIELVGWATDGSTIAPLARATVELPADGRWVPVRTGFSTPAGKRIWAVEAYLLPKPGSGPVDLDGVSLTAGSQPPSFGPLHEVDPSLLPSDAPSIWDSPVVGLGSLSTFDFGAFDDAYAYVFVHYGGLGLLAYLLLFVVVLLELARIWFARRAGRLGGALVPAAAIFVVAMLAFDVAAAAFFSYQLMAILWPILGSVLGMTGRARLSLATLAAWRP
ncbi:MAG TPA: hypothetical protein VFW92_08220 [Candidatus Limnocylindrales bacterium]|nr:hypothetical protein [Candidatus Limnocylindrales bacterium]